MILTALRTCCRKVYQTIWHCSTTQTNPVHTKSQSRLCWSITSTEEVKKEGSPWEGSAGTEIIAKYEFCQLDSRLRLTATDAETKDLEDVRSYWKETWSPFNSRDIVEQRAGRYREIRWQAYNIKSINRIVDLRTIGVEWVIYIILFPQPDLCDLPPKSEKEVAIRPTT